MKSKFALSVDGKSNEMDKFGSYEKYKEFVAQQINSISEALTKVMFGDFTVVARTTHPDTAFGYLCVMINVAINAARNAQEELVQLNDSLNNEIKIRKKVEEVLVRSQADLEKKVKIRTAELAKREEALRETLSDLKESHEKLKAAQSQLIQAEKFESVGKLAAGVAHEVKNPLAVIQVGIKYLSKNLPHGDEHATMFLENMDDSIRRADSIIKGLLDFSTSSELSLNVEELNSVMMQSLLLVEHELDKSHIIVVRELSERLPSLRLDRNKMKQVFVNIFLNACHAMPEGGTLTIKTYAKQLTEVSHNMISRKADDFMVGETVVMAEVEDTGAGIPKDQLGEIFDPFFTTKATGKGTGLGLTVTKKIIELHKGMITVGNRKEGGARVTIMFKA